jgi:hypothetical protein
MRPTLRARQYVAFQVTFGDEGTGIQVPFSALHAKIGAGVHAGQGGRGVSVNVARQGSSAYRFDNRSVVYPVLAFGP